MCRSSGMERVLPISRDFKLMPSSLVLPKEMLPFLNRRVRASAVSCWALSMSESSVMGTSSLQSLRPGSEVACSASRSMIL